MEKSRGRITSKALPRRHGIELILQKLDAHPNPSVLLEQYTIPASLAAEIAYLAFSTFGDVEDRIVVDLGTGTGRLAVAAALLGARYSIGIDVDRAAVQVARRNASKTSSNVGFVVGDISALNGPVDTVVMNPPFGTKRKHHDLYFLKKAIEIARVVYSIHKSSTRQFILNFIKRSGGTVDQLFATRLEISHTFSFHRRKRYSVQVDVIRVRSKPRGE